MNQITFPLPLFRHHLQDLLRQTMRVVRCPVGLSRTLRGSELLAASPPGPTGQFLLLSLTDTFLQPQALRTECVGFLQIGLHQRRGQAMGLLLRAPDRLEPVHRLRLVGAGMASVRLQSRFLSPTLSTAEWQMQPSIAARAEPSAEPSSGPFAPDAENGSAAAEQERWSRTIGALGREVWERLVGLRCGIIGAGRTGSGLALALARLGVRHLTLLDPDEIALGNLGEMEGVTDADLGRLKVEAVAASLRSLGPTRLEVETVPHSITRLQALHAAQSCDLLFGCVDHDSARLAATAIAALFCKPLIDIATGVHGHGPQRQMGADVRLVLPGRCLLCFGGLRDEAGARQVLASADAEHAFYTQRDWQRERAGSLASLNRLAASLAIQISQDLVAGTLAESTWAHLAFEAGHLAVSYPDPTVQRSACPVCAVSGWGEAGLPHMVDLFRPETPGPMRRTERLSELYLG